MASTSLLAQMKHYIKLDGFLTFLKLLSPSNSLSCFVNNAMEKSEIERERENKDAYFAHIPFYIE